MNFIGLKTEVESLLDKKNALINKVADLISKFCATRVKEGKASSVYKDIDNILDGFTDEEKYEILRKVVATLVTTGSFAAESSHKKGRDGIFGRDF